MKNIHKYTLIGPAIVIYSIITYQYMLFAYDLVSSSGIYGTPHMIGVFDTSATGGNAWRIILIPEEEEYEVSWSWVYVDVGIYPPTITGSLFLETVWWASFLDTTVRDDLSLSGNLWSENAGYIELDARDTSYSWVYYVPGRRSFTGYAWSDNLGYLSFSSGADTEFKNKIKIIGNIAWNKAFDTEYLLGSKFVSTNSADLINSIRKNIALLTRSVPADKMNTSNSTTKILNNLLYYKDISVDNPSSKLSSTDSRALIIEWGDLTINADVVRDPGVDRPRAIIVVKSSAWIGGNIYIDASVKNIYATIIAEWTIYSGLPGDLTNDSTTKIVNLPNTQLYIYGGVFSRNTIGWSTINICPFTENACDNQNKYKYDWNYFRTYDKTDPNRSDKTGYDEYSVIIEYDPRVYTDPPPGITY